MMTNLGEKIGELNDLLEGRQPVIDAKNPGWAIEKVYYDRDEDEVFFTAVTENEQENTLQKWTEEQVKQFNSIIDDLGQHGIGVVDRENPDWFLGLIKMDEANTVIFELK